VGNEKKKKGARWKKTGKSLRGPGGWGRKIFFMGGSESEKKGGENVWGPQSYEKSRKVKSKVNKNGLITG